MLIAAPLAIDQSMTTCDQNMPYGAVGAAPHLDKAPFSRRVRQTNHMSIVLQAWRLSEPSESAKTEAATRICV